jgi:hypothetical protein
MHTVGLDFIDTPNNRTKRQNCSKRSFVKLAQKIRVVGRTVNCAKCKQIADCYCACGTFLCVMHLGAHRCIVQLRATYSRELVEALR